MDIKKILNNTNSNIFKNKDVFDVSYIPETLQYRDSELMSIMHCIKPAIEGYKVSNTIIYGQGGTGKTSSIKKVFEEVDNETELLTCYINCHNVRTRREVYVKLYKTIFKQLPRDNLSTNIMFETVMSKLQDESIIICIDDIDRLNQEESKNIIQSLFRAHESYNINMGLFIILNDVNFKYHLEKNIQNIFICFEIHFMPYQKRQLYNILMDRCALGFYKNVIKAEQVKRMADYYAKPNGIREALMSFVSLGTKAEMEGLDYIPDTYLDEILKE